MGRKPVSLKRFQENERTYTPFKSRRIGVQLNFIYLVAVFIPILALGTVLAVITYGLLLDHHEDLLHTYNNVARKNLNEICNQTYNISDSIAYDQRTLELLGGDYATELEFRDAVRRYTLIDNFIANYGQIGSITIYSDVKNGVNMGFMKKATPAVMENDWYKKALGQFSPFYVLMVEPNNYKNMEYSLSLVRKITVPGSGVSAVMVIKISENYIENRLTDDNFITFVSFNGEEVFYSTKRAYYGGEMPFDIDYNDEDYEMTGQVDFEGDNCLVDISSFPLKSANARIYIATINKNSMSEIVGTLTIVIFIVFVALFFPAVVMRYFTKFFVRQVNTLRDEMHKASMEEYNISTEYIGSKELMDAYRDLLVMVNTIKRQKESMYEALLKEKELEREQQEMEFKMLASQINPHFLYNTLETLRMKAFTAGDKEVANGIKILGKMLRYVLVNLGTTYTSLQSELEHINHYISIQQIRFGDKVNYSLTVAGNVDTEKYMMLPLLLQPIVENAVIHGLESVDESGHIYIFIYTEGEKLIIDVADNGNGMTDETLAKVRDSIGVNSIGRHTSIGMSNIDQRIKLCYGKEYGVSIDSVYGQGTKVKVTLPKYSRGLGQNQ